jgi:MtfA peptidase
MNLLTLIIIIGVIAVIPVLFILFYIIRKKHRREVMSNPFPELWEKILLENIPIYKHFPDKLKSELKSLTLLFLDDKDFEGCGGLEITDKIRVTIAGEACMLLLKRNINECFPTLNTILVYPHAYVAGGKDVIGGRHVIEEVESVRLGESWQNGEVVLAWDHVKNGALNFDDGHNVVLHEFGHQLDQESGSANGAPVLQNRSSYKTWGKVLSHDYVELVEKTEHHKRDVIDSYGATNPAEFFAVATETFFEKPEQLYKKHLDLFEELKKYYNIDPREWVEAESKNN